MKCPNCGYITFDYLDQCKRCGANWVSERVRHGIETPTPSLGEGQSSSAVIEEGKSAVELELLLDEEFDRLYERLKREEEKASGVRWGGFLRRACAFFVDILVLFLFSSLLFYFAYVGYSVGLAAHHRSFSSDNLEVFLRLLFFAWLSLGAGYFVLFHGMEGKTVGKWFLGLRVVGAHQGPITYGQAFIRWIGALISAFFGLGFLWILWNRQRRGWHDLLAGTWVIREGSPTTLKD
ncbi:MAG: RDD family protein [Candidatus Binatia bacterium]